MNDKIRIQGARENNLKNVDLTIPRDKLVVFTGLSAPEKAQKERFAQLLRPFVQKVCLRGE